MPWNPTPQPPAGFPRAHLRPLIISTTPPRSSFLQQVSSGSWSQPLPSWPPGGTPKKADLASGLTWAPSDNYFSPTPSPTKKSQPFAVLRTHKAHHHFHLPLKKNVPAFLLNTPAHCSGTTLDVSSSKKSSLTVPSTQAWVRHMSPFP